MNRTRTRLAALGPLARLRTYQASPAQILVGGAGSIILLGTILLALPQASATGTGIGLVNALFTATSAVCVTGLIVLDTPHDFTVFGQAVILFLFQVGGLGYMTGATFVALILGRRVGLRNRLILKEAMALPTMEGLVRLATLTVKVTLVVETLAAAVLTLRFMSDMAPGRALWFGIFHAVSAFNNAGFALFTDSLLRYRSDLWVELPVTLSIVIGGLGFLALSDLLRWTRREVHRLTIHTRIVLWMTLAVGIFGTIATYLLEHGPGHSFRTLETHDAVRVAMFQSLAARTAGFATTDVAHFAPATLLLFVILMLVGGGPGSTAGGIKVTTTGVILASLWTTARGRERVTLFHRNLPQEIVQKSFFLASVALFLVIIVTWVLLTVEGTRFMPTLFEVTSAVATVGLSVGDGAGRSFCAEFGTAGKLLIVLCMFVGRLGPLTVGIAVLRSERQERYRLPEEKVLIG
jgi:trk system potassium uptake protein TrkH